MGDDLSLPERNSVRTPMQWDDEENAGFSTASREHLIRPVVSEGPFSFQAVNAAEQRDRPGSLLDHVQRLVRVRRACPEVGWGACTVVETKETSVLALRYEWAGNRVVVLHNLADKPVQVALNGGDVETLRPLMSSDGDRAARDPGAPVPLGPFGFVWFRADGERR